MRPDDTDRAIAAIVPSQAPNPEYGPPPEAAAIPEPKDTTIEDAANPDELFKTPPNAFTINNATLETVPDQNVLY